MVDLSRAADRQQWLALTILNAMEEGHSLATMLAHCSGNFVWENSGLPTIRGLAELRAQREAGGFSQFVPKLKNQVRFSYELHEIVSMDNLVFTSRTDHHWDPSGRDLMEVEIAGVMEFRGDKLARLSDYFDVSVLD